MQIIKTAYVGKNQTPDKKDVIILIVKDENGNKSFKIIKEPKLEFYVTKKEYWGKIDILNEIDIDEDKLTKITYPYNNIYKGMVQALNDPTFTRRYNNIFDSGTEINRQLRKLHLDSRFHNTDINIEDFYIDLFLKENDPEDNNFPLTKSFYDIEVDVTGYTGFPNEEEAPCPVNIITWIHEPSKEVYTFMLEYDTDTFRETVSDLNKVEEELRNKYNSYREGLGNEYKFIFKIYKTEIDLIKDFFKTVNIYKPDFCLAWNATFDYLTLVNRIKKLNEDPATIICPEEIPYKYAGYRLDLYNQDPSDNADEYKNISYTHWLDSMKLYASILKADGKLDSYALDFVTRKELGIGKDDDFADLLDLQFVDYRKFLKYNIQDVMLLVLLEDRKNNCDNYFNIAMTTRTRITKALKKTVSLRNFIMMYTRKNGRQITNNRCELLTNYFEKFEGGYNTCSL